MLQLLLLQGHRRLLPGRVLVLLMRVQEEGGGLVALGRLVAAQVLHIEQVLRYAGQVPREELERHYDASSDLPVRQGTADDESSELSVRQGSADDESSEPPGTTQQAQLADVVVEERLRVARQVLDEVEPLGADLVH